jgi:type VI protein secretion system component VasF
VVVKRRKVDLKPSRASAVAIASQANRAKKKQALIERVSNSNVMSSNRSESSGTKIPLWVWMFFGCSLMLFCVSFYHAVLRPQIEKENDGMDNVYQVAENTE